jgi:hypothetical protein
MSGPAHARPMTGSVTPIQSKVGTAGAPLPARVDALRTLALEAAEIARGDARVGGDVGGLA